jgi:hypothetical protein
MALHWLLAPGAATTLSNLKTLSMSFFHPPGILYIVNSFLGFYLPRLKVPSG